ncbi:uncharacterized protein LOC131873943 [Cryptomeria japonica]|uniref:uncharacterized protein LOC131873943 n=1 Tax=Cryptomeria japonica TaxID=3369 RepID=UPI0027D9ECCF|nr:uncharacterized protein LOC131873943 [Cryptomeria japonica]
MDVDDINPNPEVLYTIDVDTQKVNIVVDIDTTGGVGGEGDEGSESKETSEEEGSSEETESKEEGEEVMGGMGGVGYDDEEDEEDEDPQPLGDVAAGVAVRSDDVSYSFRRGCADVGSVWRSAWRFPKTEGRSGAGDVVEPGSGAGGAAQVAVAVTARALCGEVAGSLGGAGGLARAASGGRGTCGRRAEGRGRLTGGGETSAQGTRDGAVCGDAGGTAGATDGICRLVPAQAEFAIEWGISDPSQLS